MQVLAFYCQRYVSKNITLLVNLWIFIYQAEKILKIHHSHYKNTIQELCETAGVLTIRHQTGCET